jgi:hypothetical protein
MSSDIEFTIPSVGPDELFKLAKKEPPKDMNVPVGIRADEDLDIPTVDPSVLSGKPASEQPTLFLADPEVDEAYDNGLDPIPEEPEEGPDVDVPVEGKRQKNPLNKKATPSAIAGILSDKFGIDWLKWEPETLYTEIKHEFGSTPRQEVRDKIQAVKTCVLTNSPWIEWDIFENVCLALNNVQPNFKVVQDLSPAQIAFAVREMKRIRSEESLQGDALSYAAFRMHRGGLILAPDGCRACDRIIETYFHSRFNTAERAALEDTKEEVRWLWRGVRDGSLKRDLDESAVDIQLARLSAVEEYVKMMGGSQYLDEG